MANIIDYDSVVKKQSFKKKVQSACDYASGIDDITSLILIGINKDGNYKSSWVYDDSLVTEEELVSWLTTWVRSLK